jgi:hypothetical protein
MFPSAASKPPAGAPTNRDGPRLSSTQKSPPSTRTSDPRRRPRASQSHADGAACGAPTRIPCWGPAERFMNAVGSAVPIVYQFERRSTGVSHRIGLSRSSATYL